MPQNDENEKPKSTGVNRRQFITRTAAGAAGAVALTSVLDACGGSSTPAATATTAEQALSTGAWKFGVMSDTQWTLADDGNNPNTSAVGIAAQIQEQLINQGVKFVVHVGDLCDIDTLNTTAGGSNDGNTVNPAGPTNAQAGEYTRALYSQALYNAGIGFFPLRGNHDEDQPGGQVFQAVYPQTQTGQHQSPAAIVAALASGPAINGQPAFVPGSDYYLQTDSGSNPIPANSGNTFTIGSNFSSPNPWGDNGLNGLSYSFDYNSARFILLDQFVPTTGTFGSNAYEMSAAIGGDSTNYPSYGTAQQPWISQQLSGRTGSHSFVFAHKGLLTCNHTDILFTSSSGTPNQNATAQNAYFKSLYSNGVRMHINGHDHMHDRSIITSPDGTSIVMQQTCASNSSKFYVPQGSGLNVSTTIPLSTPGKISSNDTVYDSPTRRQVLSQELRTVGYYVYTINGALVNVDYYSADAPVYQDMSSGNQDEFLVNTAQGLNFTKSETYGYGINGQQFIVASGGSYNVVKDKSSGTTTAQILSGTNNCTTTDACYLPYVKLVTTGWASASSGSLSDVVAIWGINPSVADSNPDTFVLSMGTGSSLSKNDVICTFDSYGQWTNAVNMNRGGGTKTFVNGPWSSSYGLGYYGVDPTTNTAWAVLNFTGMFAIAVSAS